MAGDVTRHFAAPGRMTDMDRVCAKTQSTGAVGAGRLGQPTPRQSASRGALRVREHQPRDLLRRIDLDPMPGGQYMEERTLQVRLEVLGHTGIEIGIRRPPDELDGDIQRFHLGKTLGVPRDFFEQFRGHLSEAGPELGFTLRNCR